MILSIIALALAGPLDGKTFVVTLTDPQKKADPDTLVFAADTFLSPACEKAGFKAAPYVATQVGDTWTVVVDAASPAEGNNRWTLTVKGDHVEGALDWTKAGQAPIHYVVSGTVKK